MINVYFYLTSEQDAESLVRALLREKLVAHASIDKENVSLMYENNQVVQKLEYLVTAQSKALLFNAIVDFVANNYGGNIKIYSLPITQCNETFSEVIRKQTKAVFQ